VTEGRYKLYYLDVSYYSGKLQAYLRFKELPVDEDYISWWRLQRIALAATGVVEVPMLIRPDGVWLRDTTSIIEHLEREYPQSSVLPDDPYQRFVCRLIEDYADEWMWRPALHYRWSYAVDNTSNARRFVAEFFGMPPGLRRLGARYIAARQYRTYVVGDGVSAETRDHVEGIYLATLDQLQAVFERRPYLFGDSPSLADYGFFASMYRHFSIDPTPARIMRDRTPAVFEWVARLWNARASRTPARWTAPPGELSEGLEDILVAIGRSYLPSLYANAASLARGERRHSFTIEGVTYRDIPTQRFRAWCRERLQQHYEELPDEVKTPVRETLVRTGCWESLQQGGRIESHLPGAATLPVCAPPQITAATKLRRMINGTPHHDA
jgi:glutathione S-transferase